jgi:hypothetical protein
MGATETGDKEEEEGAVRELNSPNIPRAAYVLPFHVSVLWF